jgi:hypothetical protein
MKYMTTRHRMTHYITGLLLCAIERRVRLFVLFLKLSLTYHKLFFPLLESFFTFPKLFFFFFEFSASPVGMHLLDANMKFSPFYLPSSSLTHLFHLFQIHSFTFCHWYLHLPHCWLLHVNPFTKNAYLKQMNVT